MGLKQQIEQDLKTAMLAGDKTLVSTLRGLKSSILNSEIADGTRDAGLSEDKLVELLSKEAKKRHESADLYVQAGSKERADAELAEKAVIQRYLPKQLSSEEVVILVEKAIKEIGSEPSNMGQIIANVRQQSQGKADGALIAKLVKEKLQ